MCVVPTTRGTKRHLWYHKFGPGPWRGFLIGLSRIVVLALDQDQAGYMACETSPDTEYPTKIDGYPDTIVPDIRKWQYPASRLSSSTLFLRHMSKLLTCPMLWVLSVAGPCSEVSPSPNISRTHSSVCTTRPVQGAFRFFQVKDVKNRHYILHLYLLIYWYLQFFLNTFNEDKNRVVHQACHECIFEWGIRFWPYQSTGIIVESPPWWTTKTKIPQVKFTLNQIFQSKNFHRNYWKH